MVSVSQAANNVIRLKAIIICPSQQRSNFLRYDRVRIGETEKADGKVPKHRYTASPTADTRGKISRMAKRSRIRRICYLLLKSALVLALLSILPVIAFRFVRPPVSALMVERRIGSWWGDSNYVPQYRWVRLDKIAPEMGTAVIAAEDQTFPTHRGFDWKAIHKAIDHNETSDRTRGASTLTQQTAKNLFLWSGRTWVRKGLEAYFTILLEVFWSKSRILETYLNIAEFGDGIYGVEAAAQRYFRKPAARLNSEEAALLAAILPNPRRYSVSRPGPYVRERQQWILQQIGQLGGSSLIGTFE